MGFRDLGWGFSRGGCFNEGSIRLLGFRVRGVLGLTGFRALRFRKLGLGGGSCLSGSLRASGGFRNKS